MSLELPFGVKPVNPLASIDTRYGPYISIEDALVGTIGTREIGLTVGIITSEAIREYWFVQGITDNDLVLKIQESVLPPTQQEYSYITLSDYSPAEDVQPDINEVRIGNLIWKAANESWADGGVGIYSPDNDPINVANFGYLYSRDAILRLLTANPGYRLPNKGDFSDLGQIVGFKPNRNNQINAGQLMSTNQAFFLATVNWAGELGLNLVPGGEVAGAGILYSAFKEVGRYWMYDQNDTIQYKPMSVFPSPANSITWDNNNSTQTNYNNSFSIRLVKDI